MANVAQLVEPRFVVPVVVGSSPIFRPSFYQGALIEALFLYEARTKIAQDAFGKCLYFCLNYGLN